MYAIIFWIVVVFQTSTHFFVEGVCVYREVAFTQGQHWYDACEYSCVCKNETTGIYNCSYRCPTYPKDLRGCTLVPDPQDPECCQIPECNLTPAPEGNTTGDMCVYKDRTVHAQGSTWDDGCDQRCTCVTAATNVYQCQAKCKLFQQLPPNCTLVQDPAEPCCHVPRCVATGNIQLNPYYNTHNGSSNVKLNIVPLAPYNVMSGSNWQKPNQQTYTGQGDMCVYKDRTVHAQGSTWDDGCDQRCTCVTAATNVYQCQAKCKLFQQLPSQCTLVQDPAEPCCYVPRCVATGNIQLEPYYNTHNGSSNVTPQPGKLNIVPLAQYNVISGSNWQKPNQQTYTGQGGFGACVYKNVIYKQGQSWDDGCDYVCTCQDATKGQYQCVSKCPQLPDPLPSYCRKLSIPGQCCAQVKCDIAGITYRPPGEVIATPGPTSYLVTPSQGPIMIVATEKPTPLPGFPGQGFSILPQQFSQVRSQCIFHQKATSTLPEQYLVYNQGETWEDGCEYKCKCVDGKTGYYSCDPLCPVYNNLPSNKCFLQKIDGQCCNQPRCQLENGQVVNPLVTQTKYTIIGTLPNGYTGFGPAYNFSNTLTVTGTGGQTTVIRDVCIYKGQTYKQGQQWRDGCEFDCSCDNAKTGAFKCQPRCPSYTSLPSFCTMVKSDRDCCSGPVCHRPPVTLTPAPLTTPKPTRPTCSWCTDLLDDCEAYGQSACQAPYDKWAQRNCPNYCGFCDCDPRPTTTTEKPYTGSISCVDQLPDCKDFDKADACTGIFYQWALENCPRYCDLCGDKTTVGACYDKQKLICDSQKDIICTNPAYSVWAQENCQRTCGTCPGQVKTTQTPKGCLYSKTGVTYAHGQTWKDGCNLNCTCVNGLYNCIDICPKYPNLPSNWKLVKNPGNCCHTCVLGQEENLCHYGVQTYQQDESWSDGCKFNCTCTDASNGQYICREKCPKWELSAVCHWNPAPAGKCCPRPWCPEPYVINGYPDL